MLRPSNSLLPLVLLVAFAANISSADPVDFSRDIQPIILEHCAQCHGADEAERKSGLRLDQRESAATGGISGIAAIVPGQPAMSDLITRITSKETATLMPPPSHNKPLSAKQIELLQQWIKEGAKYESHWAFTAPQKAGPAKGRLSNIAIDAFVIDHLKEKGLALSPKATPRHSAAACISI